jgi:hypothetical protein
MSETRRSYAPEFRRQLIELVQADRSPEERMIPNTLKVGIGGAQAIRPTEAVVDEMPHCLGLHCAYFLRTHPPEGMESTIIPPIGEPDQDVGETETVQSLGGEQEQNGYLALGMGWWPGQPEAISSGKLFTPRYWTVSTSESGQMPPRLRHGVVGIPKRACGPYIEPILTHPSQFGHSTQLTDLPQSEATDSHGYGPDLGWPYP